MRRVTLILLLTCAHGQKNSGSRSEVNQSSVSTAEQPLAFAFAPAGLLFPYYLGVAFQLRDLGLLRSSTPIGGASAGSIVAAAIAFNKEESEVRSSMEQFMEDVRNGVELKAALRRQLERMIPDDEVVRAQKKLTIAYLEVLPHRQSHLVTSWESKQDLIQTILASCNFPAFFSRLPLVKCRDAWAVDGVFSDDEHTRLGCPPQPGVRTIAVLAAPGVNADFPASDIIQPRRQGMDLPDDLSNSKWMRWSLTPAPKEEIDEMIALGRSHARAWAVEQNILEPIKVWAKTQDFLERRGKLRPAQQPVPQPQPMPAWRLPAFSLSPQPSQPKHHLWPQWMQPQPEPQMWPSWPSWKREEEKKPWPLWTPAQPQPQLLPSWLSLSPQSRQRKNPLQQLLPSWTQPVQKQNMFQKFLSPRPQPQPQQHKMIRGIPIPSFARLIAQPPVGKISIVAAALIGFFVWNRVTFALCCFGRRALLTSGEESLLAV